MFPFTMKLEDMPEFNEGDVIEIIKNSGKKKIAYYVGQGRFHSNALPKINTGYVKICNWFLGEKPFNIQHYQLNTVAEIKLYNSQRED